MNFPFIIGVAGGSASGKKEVCAYITESLSEKHPRLHRRMATVSLSDFYRPLTADEVELANEGNFNFDHPDAFDWKLLEAFLNDVVAHRPTQVPKFDLVERKRTGYEPFPPTDFILLEGILVLYKRKIRDLQSMHLFVDLDSDARLAATVHRDTVGGNGRQVKPLETILNQWIRFVKPAFEDFVLPTKKHADVIIPRGASNRVALTILLQHIDDLLVTLANVNPFQTPTASELNLHHAHPNRGSIAASLASLSLMSGPHPGTTSAIAAADSEPVSAESSARGTRARAFLTRSPAAASHAPALGAMGGSGLFESAPVMRNTPSPRTASGCSRVHAV
ncbi:hypothetical protein AMAG_14146 [Allomyces macrogynus ATCC 38327]|uniref:uridine/cytidine kinase n=1 Tax=Allomyces macrogynus (strain ATCC 38327) TaxID=578462 RepID=A0A0L0T4E6_ALLM3|nr:hypothetical protein AMAG_14146 [Allomyces macrogynus ATCC 38327]|eukprot:KNE69590.1 hypothetical protein AMAG_14146 [Allomyces macrogynus ATCC 38327]